MPEKKKMPTLQYKRIQKKRVPNWVPRWVPFTTIMILRQWDGMSNKYVIVPTVK